MYEGKEIINYLGDKIGNGGIESFLSNITRGIVEKGYVFYIVANNKGKSIYEDKIKTNGGEIAYVSESSDSQWRKIKNFASFVRTHPHSIVWFHASNPGLYFYAFVVKLIGCRKIVFHIHSTKYPTNSIIKDIKYYIIKVLFGRSPMINIACSKKAGYDLYKNNHFYIIHNGIELERFKFNPAQREKIRHQYEWTKKTVIVQIGRFHSQKNHQFTLDVIREVAENNKNIELVLIGEGEERYSIDKTIYNNNMHNYVRIMSPMQDIETIYNAADILLLPSKWEGFGIVAIEAQAAGLPVICSENIVDEVLVTNFIYRISLSNKKEWIDRINDLCCKKLNREKMSEQGNRGCIDAGYTVKDAINEIINVYEMASSKS